MVNTAPCGGAEAGSSPVSHPPTQKRKYPAKAGYFLLLGSDLCLTLFFLAEDDF